MMGIFNRIKFKFSLHPYHYNERTGWSLHFRGYSIFTDQVSVRHCRFGCVEGRDRISRAEYLRQNAQIDAETASIKDNLVAKQRAEIDRLKPYEVELRRIAEELGEPNDPFAAWERLSALPRRSPALLGDHGATVKT